MSYVSCYSIDAWSDERGRLIKCPCCGSAPELGNVYACDACWVNYGVEVGVKGANVSAREGRERFALYGQTRLASQPSPKCEAPCRTCQRPNDLGVKACWWCGGAP